MTACVVQIRRLDSSAQQATLEFLIAALKTRRAFYCHICLPLLIGVSGDLLEYYRIQSQSSSQSSKSSQMVANLFYRFIALLCSPTNKSQTRKHVIVIVSHYVNTISSNSYALMPFGREARKWLKEAMYLILDVCGERDVENLRALCGLNARIALKSLWEDHSNFHKFKGKV